MDTEQQGPPSDHYQLRVSNQYARSNPNGGKPLEFWRTIELTFPCGTPPAEIEARAREAAYAAELSATAVDAQVAAGPVPVGVDPPAAPPPPAGDLFDEPQPPAPPVSRRLTPPAPGGANAAARTANPLTDKQLKAIYAIGRGQGLGEDEIEARCQAQFGCRPAELSRAEASQMIDALKGAKD
jgi:hypothetical protein